MAVQAVIFDIGNVLIGWQPEAFFDRVIGQDRSAAFFAAIPLHDMNDCVDRGESFHGVIAQTKTAYPDWEDELTVWEDRWIEMASPAIDHSVRLLRALRRVGVPVFALSNLGNETLVIAEREYPFLEEFDHRYISGEMGVTKPDPRIYEQVETHCGLPAASLLFTDDRAENNSAAQARGWQTHLFDGSQGLARRLVDAGLLTPEAAE